MSKHRTGDRTTSQIIVDRITDRVSELTEPRTETIEQWVREPGAHELTLRRTRVQHPSLVGQLRASVTGSTAGVASSAPGSKPAANLTPMSALQDIESQTRTWVRAVAPARASRPDMVAVVARLWLLVDRAPLMADEQLRNLDSDVTRWWATARTVTTWGDPPFKPHVPCSDCDAWGQVQVRLYPTSAVCLACGAAWDATTIGTLGTHVQIMLEQVAVLGPIIGPELPASLVSVPRVAPEVPAVLRGTALA